MIFVYNPKRINITEKGNKYQLVPSSIMIKSIIAVVLCSTTTLQPQNINCRASSENKGLKTQRLLSNLMPVENYHVLHLSRSVNAIIDEYLGTRSVVMFADEVRYSELGQRMLANMAHPRLLVSSTDLQMANGFIVYLQYQNGRTTDYDMVLSQLPFSDHSRHMVLWNGEHRSSANDRIDLHRIQIMFEAFWQHQLIDVAILVPMSTGSIRVYTFNPYSESRCNQTGPPIMINVWIGWKNAFRKSNKIFGLDDKLNNLHKCPLKCLGVHRPPVSTVEQTQKGFKLSGSGLHIIDFMQKHMNFTGIISMAYGNPGVHYISETAIPDNDSSPVGERVKKKKVDLAFGRFTRIFDSESEVEFIKEDQMDCFTWGLPSGIGHNSTLWTNYISEFSLITWILIFFSIILSFNVFIILSQFSFRDSNEWNLLFILFYTYASFIGAPIKITPNSCTLQVFLSNWLLYSLVITSAYQAYLGSLITIPQSTPEIDDHHTLLKTNLNLVGRRQMYYFINSSAGYSSDFKTLVDRYYILPPEDFSLFIQKILLKRDAAVLSSKRELIFYAQRYKNIFNESKYLHIIPKCMIESYSSTFMLRKGSPLRHRISTIMSRLSETGIMQKWDRVNVKEELVHGVIFTKDTILLMSQLHGAFLVLIFGLFLSFCMFIIELTVYFIKVHNKKQTKHVKFLN